MGDGRMLMMEGPNPVLTVDLAEVELWEIPSGLTPPILPRRSEGERLLMVDRCVCLKPTSRLWSCRVKSSDSVSKNYKECNSGKAEESGVQVNSRNVRGSNHKNMKGSNPGEIAPIALHTVSSKKPDSKGPGYVK